MASGDHCRFLPDYQVEHWDCDEYPNGTITYAPTGEVVRRVYVCGACGLERLTLDHMCAQDGRPARQIDVPERSNG